MAGALQLKGSTGIPTFTLARREVAIDIVTWDRIYIGDGSTFNTFGGTTVRESIIDPGLEAVTITLGGYCKLQILWNGTDDGKWENSIYYGTTSGATGSISYSSGNVGGKFEIWSFSSADTLIISVAADATVINFGINISTGTNSISTGSLVVSGSMSALSASLSTLTATTATLPTLCGNVTLTGSLTATNGGINGGTGSLTIGTVSCSRMLGIVQTFSVDNTASKLTVSSAVSSNPFDGTHVAAKIIDGDLTTFFASGAPPAYFGLALTASSLIDRVRIVLRNGNYNPIAGLPIMVATHSSFAGEVQVGTVPASPSLYPNWNDIDVTPTTGQYVRVKSAATYIDCAEMEAWTGTALSTVTVNAALGDHWKGILTANATLTITNGSPGQTLRIEIAQDGTGSRTLTLDSASIHGGADYGGASPAITLSTAANAVDVLYLEYSSYKNKFIIVDLKKGF